MSGENRTSETEQAEIDAALDAALDALDEDTDEDAINPRDEDALLSLPCTTTGAAAAANSATVTIEKASSPSQPLSSSESPNSNPTTETATRRPPVLGPPRPPPPVADDVVESEIAMMSHMMQQLLSQAPPADEDSNAFFGELLQEMQSQFQSELQTTTAASPTSSATRSTPAQQQKSKQSSSSAEKSNITGEEVSKAVSALMDEMAKQATVDKGNKHTPTTTTTPGGANEMEMLQSLMESLGEAGDVNGGNDADALLDGMMEQLLSKDLMYEPMKQVAAKFPDWLKERRRTLSEEEYAQRCSQCECFQQLVRVYETEPDNTEKLMTLMQAVQEYGQPPPEIIQEIAPGLELDQDGMPKLNASGLPFPGTDEECRIM